MSTLTIDKAVVTEVAVEVKSSDWKSQKKEFCDAQKYSRMGETRINNQGSKMFIIEYSNSQDVTVQFMDGFITNASYQHFCDGSVKSPNDASVYGVGYLGVGSHQAYIDCKATIQYNLWKAMIQRCYSAKSFIKHPTYIGCSVSDEFLNFQTFATWYDNNSYECESELQLDKDILFKGNKVYSPDMCCLVPRSINMLFVNRKAKRGNTPIGVTLMNGKYQTRCNAGKGKLEYLGTFDTPELAFNCYKEFKESFIKQVAESYKGVIPQKLYDAMYTYESFY